MCPDSVKIIRNFPFLRGDLILDEIFNCTYQFIVALTIFDDCISNIGTFGLQTPAAADFKVNICAAVSALSRSIFR
jgi:hypothetical protein